jgi:hypothetical protein
MQVPGGRSGGDIIAERQRNGPLLLAPGKANDLILRGYQAVHPDRLLLIARDQAHIGGLLDTAVEDLKGVEEPVFTGRNCRTASRSARDSSSR